MTSPCKKDANNNFTTQVFILLFCTRAPLQVSNKYELSNETWKLSTETLRGQATPATTGTRVARVGTARCRCRHCSKPRGTLRGSLNVTRGAAEAIRPGGCNASKDLLRCSVSRLASRLSEPLPGPPSATSQDVRQLSLARFCCPPISNPLQSQLHHMTVPHVGQWARVRVFMCVFSCRYAAVV